MFPIKRISERTDSSIKTLEEAEFDKRNELHHQKNSISAKNSERGLPPVATVHKTVHNKKFPN
jgi:hypothetical protein